MNRKSFEFLDVVKFAKPSVTAIDPLLTSRNRYLLEYLHGAGWSSYKPIWSKMPRIWQGPLSDVEISTWWKSGYLIDAMQALRDQYQGSGRWYELPYFNRPIAGVNFRSSAHGVLFSPQFGAEVHVINPRKTQILSVDSLGFLARAAYEEFAIDDPNKPSIAILDMSCKIKSSNQRKAILYRKEAIDMVSVGEFEDIVNKFIDALRLSGLVGISKGSVTADQFRARL